MLFGTAVSALMALVLATPLAIAIAIISRFVPASVRAIVGPLVEMLAAIPSVVLGLWGVIVLARSSSVTWSRGCTRRSASCDLRAPQTTGLSVFTAGLVLTVMVIPIIAALSRDLFLTVPRELKEGAEALGATRWEVIRGVVLPMTVSAWQRRPCSGWVARSVRRSPYPW